MSGFTASFFTAVLICGVATAQLPSTTSPSPAPGKHMEESTVQSIGSTPNGAGARPQPTPESTAWPTTGGNKENALIPNPPQPVTKTLAGGTLVDPGDVADLLAPTPLRPSKLSLIGGAVTSIDQIRDKMTIRIYGAGSMHVKFDQRTHFYRDGKETTQMTVKRGDRVYLDTQLFEGKVFAKNVQVESGSSAADASGQIVSFNPKSGDMIVEDQLLGSTVKFRVDQKTTIKNGEAKTTPSALRRGALVAVKFSPRSRGTGSAEEVSIIAEPGTSFTYFGRVTHLDLHSGLLAVANQADGKTYEIHFTSSTPIPENLMIGSQVTAVAMFRGNDYAAESIEVNGGPETARVPEDQASPSSRSPLSDDDRAGQMRGRKSHSPKQDRAKPKGESREKSSPDNERF